jgi:hypothetical protein
LSRWSQAFASSRRGHQEARSASASDQPPHTAERERSAEGLNRQPEPAAPPLPDDGDRVVLSDHAKALLGAIFATWPGATIKPVPIAWAPPPNIDIGADAAVVEQHVNSAEFSHDLLDIQDVEVLE